MKHHRAEDDIELRIPKRQRFGDRILERHLNLRSSSLRRCPLYHFGGRVDADDLASRANRALGDNGNASGPTAHIEDSLAGFETREGEELFAKRAISSMGD